MDDSTLWAVALGVGALGLLLVVVAGVAAISTNARARQSRQAQPAPEPPPHADSAILERSEGGGVWLWLKAGVFAFIHAGAVSFVLGGLTFFEDIARASEEMRTTGSITFPKRLLPKALTGPDAGLPFSRSSGELPPRKARRPGLGTSGQAGHGGSAAPDDDADDWEVVGVISEGDGRDQDTEREGASTRLGMPLSTPDAARD